MKTKITLSKRQLNLIKEGLILSQRQIAIKLNEGVKDKEVENQLEKKLAELNLVENFIMNRIDDLEEEEGK